MSFPVTILHGNELLLKYQGDIQLKEVHGGKFEGEIAQRLEDIVSYLKKEFKKITKKALTLKDEGPVDALVQQTSRVRVFVIATKTFEVGNLSNVDAVEGDSTVKVKKI